VFPGTRSVRLIDHPEPCVEKPTQVMLKILEVGICGTDKEIVHFAYGTPPPGSDYLIPGHECLAEVVEVGAGVDTFSPGDIVIPSVRRPCPHRDCLSCAVDRADHCYTGDFVERGIKGVHGYMTEYVVEEYFYLTKAPPEIRRDAVLVEPLTVAEKALQQMWCVQERLPWVRQRHLGRPTGLGHQALVLGAGPVGLLGAMALRSSGFDVWVYSKATKGDMRDEVVRGIGAHFLLAGEVNIDNVVRDLGSTLDVVYEAVGASQLAFDCLRALGPNGLFIFTGVPGRKGPISIDADEMMRNLVLKNQIAMGTVNASRDAFESAVTDLSIFRQRWPDALDKIITNRIPLERGMEPLSGKIGGIKNVLTMR